MDLENEDNLALNVGSYLLALDSKHLQQFMDVAEEFALSKNYLQRVLSHRILQALNKNIPYLKNRELPSFYYLNIVSAPLWHFDIFKELENGTVNLRTDLSGNLAPVIHLIEVISELTQIDKTKIAFRINELISKEEDDKNWFTDKDDKLSRHYSKIGLFFPSLRQNAKQAFEATMELITELLDTRLMYKFDDRFLSLPDYFIINFKPSPKPPFIQRIVPLENWHIEENWLSKGHESKRFNNQFDQLGGKFVIGEISSVIRKEEDFVKEEFCILLDKKANCNYTDNNAFFGESAFLSKTEDYLDLGYGDTKLIIRRSGYFQLSEDIINWLAFNPSIAFKMGWLPDNNSIFAWNNEKGERMVESIYWQSGNPSLLSPYREEVGEGWLVLASQKAVNQLISNGYKILHKIDNRFNFRISWLNPKTIHKKIYLS